MSQTAAEVARKVGEIVGQWPQATAIAVVLTVFMWFQHQENIKEGAYRHQFEKDITAAVLQSIDTLEEANQRQIVVIRAMLRELVECSGGKVDSLPDITPRGRSQKGEGGSYDSNE